MSARSQSVKAIPGGRDLIVLSNLVEVSVNLLLAQAAEGSVIARDNADLKLGLLELLRQHGLCDIPC